MLWRRCSENRRSGGGWGRGWRGEERRDGGCWSETPGKGLAERDLAKPASKDEVEREGPGQWASEDEAGREEAGQWASEKEVDRKGPGQWAGEDRPGRAVGV